MCIEFQSLYNSIHTLILAETNEMIMTISKVINYSNICQVSETNVIG